MTSSEVKRLRVLLGEMSALVEQAAPLVAITAFKGGSLFYKAWVDRARGLGIEIDDPTTHPAQEGEGTSGELE